MSLIAKETNSYAFRVNSAKNSQKTLEIQELYHFFGCLIKLALFKHPPRAYCWASNGILAQVPLSKNRFEAILSNFHFKDRGFAPEKNNWWEKLEPIYSILKEKCSHYWLPSINLTIDEIMIKFKGRTSQKITIPGKPIPTGFKIFALRDSGYTYNQECTKPGLVEGFLVEKTRISINILDSELFSFLNLT